MHESDEQTAIRECRMLFLRTAAEHPQVQLGKTLRRTVFEPLQRLWGELGLHDREFSWTDEGQKRSRAYGEETERLLESWADSHALLIEWVVDAGREQIGTWFPFPEHGAFETAPGYHPPEFYVPTWFQVEGREEYRTRTLQRFRADLDKYIRTVEKKRRQLLKDHGSQAAHYTWCVERACLGWTYSQIALKNGSRVSSRGVQKAVSPILKRIGIPESTT
jgi:hypothetical protein